MVQVVEEPAWRGVVLHLVLMKKEGLVWDVGCWGSLGCSDHDMVELKNLCGGNRAESRIPALDFRRAEFGLFREVLGGIPWVRGLEGMGWVQVVKLQALLLQR